MKPSFWQFFKCLIFLWAALTVAIVSAKADTVPPQRQAPKPAVAKPTLDKAFVFHVAALGSTDAFDKITTSRFLNYSRRSRSPGTCHEVNPYFGPAPSDGRLATRSAIAFGGEIAASFLLKKLTKNSSHRWIRESWRAPMLYWTGDHIAAGAWNLANCGS